MGKIAICIPTYKNRYPEFFDMVNDLANDYDIYLFYSPGNYEESGYDKYAWHNNVRHIHTEAKNISEKRKYLLQYMKDSNYDYCYSFDDDISPNFKTITPESKRPAPGKGYRAVDIHYKDVLKTMETYKEDYVIVTISHPTYLGLSSPTYIVINGTVQCEVMLFNLKMIREHDVFYEESEFKPFLEDTTVILNALKKGLNNASIRYIGTNHFTDKGTSLSYGFDTAIVNMYLTYRDLITPRISTNGCMAISIAWRKFFNRTEPYIIDDEYHNGLYEICKTHDIEAIKEYIINNCPKPSLNKSKNKGKQIK